MKNDVKKEGVIPLPCGMLFALINYFSLDTKHCTFGFPLDFNSVVCLFYYDYFERHRKTAWR